MAFGKSKIDKICLEAVAQLKETDYTKADPQIGQMYQRLVGGRSQLETVMERDLSAVTQISSLEKTFTIQIAWAAFQMIWQILRIRFFRLPRRLPA